VEKLRLLPDAGAQVAKGESVKVGARLVSAVPNGIVQKMASSAESVGEM
jgi:hypothetical protein